MQNLHGSKNWSPDINSQFFIAVSNLEQIPLGAEFHLFADCRYRRFFNDQFVYAEPGRFVTQFPEFDTVDIQSFLQGGENKIEVEVNYFGASSYQTMPDSQPGFIAWGQVEEHSLFTPGDWKAEVSEQCASNAPAFSFAQSPIELRDLRKEHKPVALRLVEGADAPWGY